MIHPNFPFWRSVGTMIGSIVGVGVFGLPFAISQAGFPLGLLMLFLIAGMMTGMQLMYAEVAIQTEGDHQLVGYVREWLGETWSWIAVAALFSSLAGAMVAYLIVGGRFLHILLEPLMGGSEAVYALGLGVVAGFFIHKGLQFASRMDAVIVSGLLFLFLFVVLAAAPHIEVSNLAVVPQKGLVTLYGVILFSFAGTGIVPEMKKVLGKKQWHKLPLAVLLGMGIILWLYASFSFAVVGVTGQATTETAFEGLIPVLGQGFGVVGALIGSLTILSIYTILGVIMKDTLVVDFNMKKTPSWLLVAGAPLVMFLLGLREFIGIVGFVGAVFTGLTGIIIVLMYEKMRASPVCAGEEKKCLDVPSIIPWLIIFVFAVGILAEIITKL